MRRLLIAALLAALPACGGGVADVVVPPAQAADLAVTPIPIAPNAVECVGAPCASAIGRSAPGGQPGNVNSSLSVRRLVVPDTASFEWAGLFVLDNHALRGENVALYAQGNARSSGPTWGLVSEAIDWGYSQQPNLIGAEINLGTLRPHNGNQLGVHSVAHARTGALPGAGGTAAFVADGGTARWEVGYRAQGRMSVLFDAWRAQEATLLADLPMPLLKPAAGRHVGNLPVRIGGQTYFLPVYQ